MAAGSRLGWSPSTFPPPRVSHRSQPHVQPRFTFTLLCYSLFNPKLGGLLFRQQLAPRSSPTLYAMLHRRPTTGGPSGGPPPASSASYGQPSSGPTVNKAYTPLRRQSNTLYPTPGSGPRARYSISSPSNSFVGASPTGNGAAAAPSFDPGVGGFGGFGGANGNGYPSRGGDSFEGYGDKSDLPQRYLRLLRDGVDKFRRGAEDALRLDRSWNLVWG